MENNNPNGGNINQNGQNPVAMPTVAPTPMPQGSTMPQMGAGQTPAETAQGQGQAQAPSQGGMNAEAAQMPTSAPTGVVLAEQNAGMTPGTGMVPETMPAGASLRPETMQSQKVTKSIKLPGAKKSHKGLIITIIITIVLALGAGAAWWFMAGPGKAEEGQGGEQHWPCTSEDPGLCLNGEESSAGSGTDEVSTEVEITPEEEERRVREVVEMMRARAVEFLREKGLTTDIALTEISEGSGIRVRPDGWGAAVDATKSIGYGVVDRTNTFASSAWAMAWNDVILENEVIAQALFEENGFQSYGSVGMGSGLVYNPESGVYCGYEASIALFDFGCTYKTWVDESQKEMVNQMAAGYLDGTGNEIMWVGIDMSRLENSSVAPYQRIWVDIPGAAAEFYRVSPEAEWKFFRAGQDGAACDEYNTDELKNAYAGVTCHVWNGSRDEYYTVEAAN